MGLLIWMIVAAWGTCHAQSTVSITKSNSNLQATADNVVFTSTNGSYLTDIQALVAATQLTQSNGDLNSAGLQGIEGQLARQLNFTGAAAPLNLLYSLVNGLSAEIQVLRSEIARLESASLAQCNELCVHGNCSAQQGTGHFSCTCTPPYIGRYCEDTLAPTSAPTAVPTAAPTYRTIPSCEAANVSGTYGIGTGTSGFTAYCKVNSDGSKWMKISHWRGGSYQQTQSAHNPSMCEVQSTLVTGTAPQLSGRNFCKLSDDQINSVIPSGRARYYWIDASASGVSQVTKSAYARTSQPYNDVLPSFGCFGAVNPSNANCQGNFAATFPGTFSNPSTFTYGDFFEGYIDAWAWRYNGQVSRDETCDRLFMGHRGGNDCWSMSNGNRCVRGGGNCRVNTVSPMSPAGRYAMIPGITVWQALVPT